MFTVLFNNFAIKILCCFLVQEALIFNWDCYISRFVKQPFTKKKQQILIKSPCHIGSHQALPPPPHVPGRYLYTRVCTVTYMGVCMTKIKVSSSDDCICWRLAYEYS